MDKRLLKFSWLIALFLFTQFAAAQEKNVLPAWALGGFARPEGINPIISPVSASEFYDPMSKKMFIRKLTIHLTQLPLRKMGR